MERLLETSIQNVPAYFAYLVTLVALVVVYTLVYKLITPYRELELVRQGNRAAATSLAGTIIGVSIALNSIAAGSGSLLDMVMWGGIALASQLAVFVALSVLLRDLRTGIEEDRMSYGILLGGSSIAIGVLNAGALTY